MSREKKILILKTSILNRLNVIQAGKWIIPEPYIFGWHVDLEDCDKVLRIECYGLDETDIVKILNRAGFEAEKLQ